MEGRKKSSLEIGATPTIMPIRAIFFDIGDTLLFDDPPLRERFQIALRQTGIAYPEDGLDSAFRVGEEYAVTRYLEGLPFDDPQVMRETAARMLAALGVPELSDTQWQALAQSFVGVGYTRRLHPQALPLVKELRGRGFKVGAISDWEETLPELLEDLALAPYLDALAVSAIVGVTKPDPRMFHEGLRQIGVAPEEALHIGDWYELDACGAQSVGMQAVLFDHPRRRPDADCPRVETFDQLTASLLALPCPV